MPNDTDLHQPQPHSQLFTVRLWSDTEQPGEHTSIMQVKHVLSGETRYFREWEQVKVFILAKVNEDSTNCQWTTGSDP